MDMKLKGKTALVTGAGKRVGREIALGLARRGANVVVHYNTSAADAREVVGEIKALGVDAIAVKANQANAREVRAAVGKARETFWRYPRARDQRGGVQEDAVRHADRSGLGFAYRCEPERAVSVCAGSRAAHEGAGDRREDRHCLPIGRRSGRMRIICRTACRRRA